MTRKDRSVHTVDGHCPPRFSIIGWIAVAVLSIAVLLCLPSCYVEELKSPNKSLPLKTDEVKKPEKWYSHNWCTNAGGDDSVTLRDRTKPDCVLPDRVIEFDFGKGMKPYECVGQAIHYGRVTGKKPECILIQRSDISDETFQHAVRKAQSGVISCGISLRCLNHDGAIVSCPKRRLE